jgi:hypothetical protein
MSTPPKWAPFALGAALVSIGVAVFANRASAKSNPLPPNQPNPHPLYPLIDPNILNDIVPPHSPTMLTSVLTPVPLSGSSLVGPQYLVKYTAEALQLIATPAQGKPVMLCSYYPFIAADATELATANALYSRLKVEHETAPEDLYRQHGRRWITRLRQRFFDPKSFKELPSDTIELSDNLFPVPIYSLDTPNGTPCG